MILHCYTTATCKTRRLAEWSRIMEHEEHHLVSICPSWRLPYVALFCSDAAASIEVAIHLEGPCFGRRLKHERSMAMHTYVGNDPGSVGKLSVLLTIFL